MASHDTKRKLVRRPGLAEAARALGCTLSHLRRVVIGERKSLSLTRRFRDWRTARKVSATPITQTTASPKP